jgi:hypothetical protein
MFWLREVMGWALVAISLIVLRVGMNFAMNTTEPKIVEASVVLFTAMGVLRAGILLIRISTAARICRIDREGESKG